MYAPVRTKRNPRLKRGFSTGTVGKVPYPAYPGYIPGVSHTEVRVGIVGMAVENT